LLSGTCPICSGIKTVHAFTAVDLNWETQGSFPYIRCNDCGAFFRPAGSTLPAGAYPWGYGSFLNPESHLLQSRIDSIANRRRAAFLESIRKPGTILDVGCGSGFFLAYLCSQGWHVHGLETAVEHVAFARDILGLLNVSMQAWPPTNGTLRNFDAVSMIHLIEHMPDPITALTAAHQSLCKGGVLLLETPNIDSWPARIFGPQWVTLDAPRHMVLFGPKSLARCLRSAGFEEIRRITYSPSTMDWSESLRYSLNRMRVRRFGEAVPASHSLDNVWQNDRSNKTRRERILGPVHTVERLIYRLINFVADTAGYGGNILVVASPVRCRDNPS
jgi:2-polyprenyl-3-methyl-5-hydroxy-6-metoxy-1,4-benzoquinol methylase